MAQAFTRESVFAVKLFFLAAALLVISLGFLVRWRLTLNTAENQTVLQPIPFSHKHHVGDDGLDCRFCHTGVERSSFAGLPSTDICLTCHAQLFKDAPVLAPLHDSRRSGMPVRWNRVYDLPDFVYFDHSIHVNKGVACVECHGRVDQMALTRLAAPLTMQWCLDCHRNVGPHLRLPEQVFSMQAAQPVSVKDQRQLAAQYHIQSTRRLTDCSTCHR